jgi:hypothetical protein
MTLQEFLKTVEFGKIAGAFKKMYPDDIHMLPFLKCHYDILCHMIPVYDETANAQECRVSNYYDETVKKSYLSAFPLEGDCWRVSLCKKMVIDSSVIASDEEIAACCLWHTSFYGYTERQQSQTAKDLLEHSDKTDLEISLIELNKNLHKMEKLGCKIDSLPTYEDVKGIVKMRANINYKNWKQKHIKKRVRNRLFRRDFLKAEYNNYLSAIARFILDICMTNSNQNASTLQDLCKLFQAKCFAAYSYQSYTFGESNSAEYLTDLITQYAAFDRDFVFSNVIFCLEKAENNLALTSEEEQLRNTIYSLCPKGDNETIINSDSSLKGERRILVGFYQ